MGDTKIQWSEKVWNPIRGCTPVSPGCQNCYAAKVAKRFSFPGGPFQGLVRINAAGERTDEWNGEITYVEDHLLDPIRWKKPRRIFVNSVSDLFHHNVSDTVIDRIFAVMALAPQHTFQVLTKRPERMRDYLLSRSKSIRYWEEEARNLGYTLKFDGFDGKEHSTCRFPLPHVWLGTSVENQKYADERIPYLLQTPAAVRFISAEPLLGHINLVKEYDGVYPLTGVRPYHSEDEPKLDWVICGGESQRGSRPMNHQWARDIRDQCKAAGVAFFFKQWGDWWPNEQGNYAGPETLRQRAYDEPGEEYSHVGSKKAGDYLDGVQHHEYPEVRA
jgi:protein gp37